MLFLEGTCRNIHTHIGKQTYIHLDFRATWIVEWFECRLVGIFIFIKHENEWIWRDASEYIYMILLHRISLRKLVRLGLFCINIADWSIAYISDLFPPWSLNAPRPQILLLGGWNFDTISWNISVLPVNWAHLRSTEAKAFASHFHFP